MTSYLKIYLQNDLEQILKSVVKEFETDYKLTDKQRILKTNIFNHLGPMLLLAFTKSHSSIDKSRVLATAIYFILLGHELHQERQSSNPLNILFGDYFYTKFFTYLCKQDLLHWADEFANIICHLQEAAIVKSQTNLKNISTSKLDELAEKDYANICELCCKIVATFRHLDKNTLLTLKRFGKNTGKYIYFADLVIDYELAMNYLVQANNDLVLLSSLEPPKVLYDELNQYKLKIDKQKIEFAV
jgi:octaprenyl-diphosphate synthase